MPQARHPDVRVVVHGHFYQPPRENPWTDEVPRQPSAHPHHDWNERVLAECYRPNTASRVLDPFGRIRAIVNNFESLSFDVGPTLMTWLERQHPDVYGRVLQADRASRRARSGHGNAIAQAYNHMILPLANDRDRRTQVLWGLREFEYRFGRAAEGMWLPETAIHAQTVQTLIECGVRFTVLSPYQARRVRPLRGGEWQDVSGGRIDPKMPYRILGAPAPDGSPRGLDVFFYDGPLSRAMAFEHLLRNADTLAERLVLAVDPARQSPQLVSLAVDGETFGHHEAFGDMCMAAFFTEKASPRGFRLTNYGEFLDEFPPTHELELVPGDDGEGTAWSCAHGVGRWSRDCGCATGAPEKWNQAWRRPLRAAFDRLRDAVALLFESHAAKILHDPWAARDEYVDVVVRHPDPDAVEAFLARHLRAGRPGADRVAALQLVEAQRHAMSMYTSCGWFFADVTGIETVQNLRYAARCVQLMRGFGDEDLEQRLLADLESAHSNNGRDSAATIYRRWIQPEVRSAERAVNARAIFRLLDASRGARHVYGFELREHQAEKLDFHGHNAHRGHVWLRDRWTWWENELSYLALEYAPRDLRCFVTPADAARHVDVGERVADLPEILEAQELETALTEIYGAPPYGIGDLLPEHRRRIARRLAAERVSGLRHHYRAVFDDSQDLLEDFAGMQLDLPEELRAPCEFTMQADVEKAARNLRQPYSGPLAEHFENVLATSRRLGLRAALEPVADLVRQHLVDEIRALREDLDPGRFEAANNLLHLAEHMELPVDRTEAEELMHDLLRLHVFPALEAGPPDIVRAGCVEAALDLAARLNFAVDDRRAGLHAVRDNA